MVKYQISNIEKKGFTLAELLIVMAIIGIMTSMTLVYIGSGNRTDKELEVESRKVVAAIRETQNYSLTGKNAAPSCGNQNIFNYGKDSNGIENNSVYSIAGCNTVNYVLGNQVVFGGSSASFAFSVPHGIMSPSDDVVITLMKSGKTRNICVYASGRIEEGC